MKIGQIEIPQLCRLAPMAAISNAPFRLIAKECGSGLTTTEEMDAFALLMDTRLAGDMAAYYPQERPLAMQLLGRDPQALIRAAHRCEELGADIVDLNMGCPMPKITGKGKGAALMKDVPGTARLLRAMRQTIAVPFTIKIRGGWDDLHLNAVDGDRRRETANIELERLLFQETELTPEAKAKLRSDLLRYCHQDTWGLVKLLERLRQLALPGPSRQRLGNQ
jgi:tRNA-dihydrouridine synthase